MARVEEIRRALLALVAGNASDAQWTAFVEAFGREWNARAAEIFRLEHNIPK